MYQEAIKVFEQYQEDLEHEPAMIGLRLFLGEDGGLVWRNKAQREHYEREGIIAATTLPWVGVAKMFTKCELVSLKQAYRAAFASDDVVRKVISFYANGQSHRLDVEFLAVYGNIEAGVIMTRQQSLI